MNDINGSSVMYGSRMLPYSVNCVGTNGIASKFSPVGIRRSVGSCLVPSRDLVIQVWGPGEGSPLRIGAAQAQRRWRAGACLDGSSGNNRGKVKSEDGGESEPAQADGWIGTRMSLVAAGSQRRDKARSW